MTDSAVYPVSEAFQKKAFIDNDTYLALYKRSVEDNEAFWGDMGKRIEWFQPYTTVKDVSFDKSDLHIRWFADGLWNTTWTVYDQCGILDCPLPQ